MRFIGLLVEGHFVEGDCQFVDFWAISWVPPVSIAEK